MRGAVVIDEIRRRDAGIESNVVGTGHADCKDMIRGIGNGERGGQSSLVRSRCP